jgi:hypothetical protein
MPQEEEVAMHEWMVAVSDGQISMNVHLLVSPSAWWSLLVEENVAFHTLQRLLQCCVLQLHEIVSSPQADLPEATSAR